MLLANFPIVNQLAAPVSAPDGVDENAVDNCFVAAPTAMLNWLTDASLDPDAVLDAVYPGDSYSGGGNSWDPPLLAFYRAHGCILDDARWADDSNVGDVLAYVRGELDQGRPVLCTWPSQWGIETRDTATGYHAVVCIGYDPGSYIYMNVWGGEYQTYPADWSASRLVNAGSMRRVAAVSYTGLGSGFADYAAAHNLTAPLVTPGEVATGNPNIPGEAFACFAPDAAHPAGVYLYYTQANGVQDDRGPWLVLELWQHLHAAQTPAPDPTIAAKAAAYDRMLIASKLS